MWTVCTKVKFSLCSVRPFNIGVLKLHSLAWYGSSVYGYLILLMLGTNCLHFNLKYLPLFGSVWNKFGMVVSCRLDNKHASHVTSMVVFFFLWYALKNTSHTDKYYSPDINIRGSYRKSWTTIFCQVTCFIIDKPNTPP